MQRPKVLILDIETFGLVVETWGIWDQKILPDQILKDWCVASWAAKWLGDPPEKTMYMDNRDRKDPRNDERIIKGIHKLINEADIIVGQNSKAFDIKRLNARFAFYDLKATSPFKHFDTKQVAKNKFGFTSNSLKDLCKYFKVKYQKSDHKKFPGRELWRQCEAKNLEAWEEMKKYNITDVLATEGVYKKLEPWYNQINVDVYGNLDGVTCGNVTCLGKNLQWRGYSVTSEGKFRRFQCQDCGTWSRTKGAKNNELSKEQKENLRKRI